MEKSPDAFRTISEVADWLGVQAHVLRFWESKFTQVKPVKRAGGRRYYRPSDMLLLGGIKQLLYEDGMTIKGVQKILREQGAAHVSEKSQPLDENAPDSPKIVSPGDAGDAVDLGTISPQGAADSITRSSRQIELTMDFDAGQASPRSSRPDQELALDASSADARQAAGSPDGAPVGTSESTPVETDQGAFEFRRRPPEAETAPKIETETPDLPPDTPVPPAEEEPSTTASPLEESPASEIPPLPAPRIVDAPDPPDEASIDCPPGALAQIAALRSVPPEHSAKLSEISGALASWLARQTEQHAGQ